MKADRKATVPAIVGLLAILLFSSLAGAADDPVREAVDLFYMGERERALALLEQRIAEVPSDVDAHLAYCEMRIRSGEREKVRKEYNDWAEREPDNRAVRLVHMVLSRQSMVKYSIMEDFLRKNPDYARGYEELGKAYLEGTRVSQARAALAEAVRLDPNRALARLHLALAHRAAGEHEEEEKELRRAMELDPEMVVIQKELGAALYFQGDAAEAAKILEPLRSRLGTDRDYLTLLSRVLTDLGRLDEAEEARRAALEGTTEEYLGDLVFRGLRLRNAWRLDEGEQLMLDAIHLDSTFLEAYMQLGILYRMRKDPEKSIETYTKATRFGSLNQLAWRNLGISYRDRGDLEMAETYFRKAVEVDPDYLTGWVDLARVLGRLGDFDEAIENWKRVISMAPYGWEAMEARETLYYLEKGEIPPEPEEQSGLVFPNLPTQQ
ncbi:MAG: tetratricopeptide repeat protein [Candidatus Eisenbacteria bacterium]|nr:tetratricopeptide repeat protein [Candidatus Eisenbacteria bacterium]